MGNSKSKRTDKGQQEQREDHIQKSLELVQEEWKEYRQLAKVTHFDEETVHKLYDLFNFISSTNVDDQRIDLSEFAQALGMKCDCIIPKMIFERFNITKTKAVTFREFVTALSILSPDATLDEKIRFSFELYDINHDSRIDLSELKRLLLDALSNSGCEIRLSDAEIDSICESTLRENDLDGNGSIDFKEYQTMCHKNPQILAPFTIDIKELLDAYWKRRQEEKQGSSDSASRILSQERDSGNNNSDNNGDNDDSDDSDYDDDDGAGDGEDENEEDGEVDRKGHGDSSDGDKPIYTYAGIDADSSAERPREESKQFESVSLDSISSTCNTTTITANEESQDNELTCLTPRATTTRNPASVLSHRASISESKSSVAQPSGPTKKHKPRRRKSTSQRKAKLRVVKDCVPSCFKRKKDFDAVPVTDVESLF